MSRLSFSTAGIVAFVFAIVVSPSSSTLLPVKRQLTRSEGFTLHAHGTGVKYTAGVSPTSPETVTVKNLQDASYTVDVNIGGQDVNVLLDTGSSDFWVYLPNSTLRLNNVTDLRVTESYVVGEASGPIAFAEFSVGKYNIPNQAFVNVDSVKDMSDDSHGILGMLFDVGSVYNTIKKAYGDQAAARLGKAPITNIFAQNSSQPNYFDVYLGRTSDLDDISDGTFTISEHVDGYGDVEKQPKLQRIGDTHWVVPLDGLEVNGKAFSFSPSPIQGVPTGKIAAGLDTGFTLPPIPPQAVDFIYSSFEGAILDNGTWFLPCLGATNVTFILGGQPYPIHPLDLTRPVVIHYEEDGQTVNSTICVNNYQYFNLDPVKLGVDAILGDAFLRNVYASHDYGDYDPVTKTEGQPFVQLLSTTNRDAAWAEFNKARALALKSLPPSVDPSDIPFDDEPEDKPAKTSGALNTDDVSTDSDSTSLVKKYGPIIIGLLAGNLLVGTLLLLVGMTLCVKGLVRSGARTRTLGVAYTQVGYKDEQ